MATITSKIVRGTSDSELNSIDYAKYIWTETGLGANTFTVDKNTVSATLNLTGLTGDVINVGGYSGDYTAQLTNSMLKLQNSDQTISVSLAKNSIVTLNFSDGPKEVNLKYKTLDDQSLVTKTGVLHINGATFHETTTLAAIASREAQALAAAAKLAAQDKAAALAAAAQDKATALAAAAQDKATALALAVAHETSVVAAASKNALTVTSGVTAGKTYLSVNAAIDDAIKAVTSYPTLAEFTDAYNKLLLPTFSVTGNSVVTEGNNATFVVNLSNQGSTGIYTVYADLKGDLATPGTDFASSLTLVDTDGSLEKLKVTLDANGKLTIPAAARISNVTLSSLVSTDMETENGERLNLTLSTPSNAVLGANKSVSTTINDVQLLPTFSISGSSSVTEGKDAIFLVNLANRGTSDYSVKTKLSPKGTANAISNEDFESTLKLDQDYTGVNFDNVTGVLTISKNATVSSIKLVSSVKTDLITPEIGEELRVELSAPTNAELSVKSWDTTIADLAPPTFSVKPQTATIDEGGNAVFVIGLDNKGADEYQVNIKLDGINVLTSLSNPVNPSTSVANNTVNAATLALTPVILANLQDFDPTLSTQSLDADSILAGVKLTKEGLLTIPANTNVSSVKLSIPVKSDQVVTPETDEGIKLTLSLPNNAINAVIGAGSTAKMTIIDKTSTALTPGLDSITGGNGDSTYTATGFTLNVIDNINDSVSTDNDFLNITTDRPIPAATISGIETINLTALNNVAVDMKPATGGFTGVNTFNIKDSTGVVTLTNIPNATMAIGLNGSGVNNVIATYSTNATPATSVTTTNNDKLLINLNTASNADITVKAPFYVDSATGKFASFETAEINVSGQSSITNYQLITAGTTTYLPTLTISGTGALTIGEDALLGVTDILITDTGPIKIGSITDYPLQNLNALNAGAITTDSIKGALIGINALFSSYNDNVKITSAATSGSNTVKLGGGSDILNMTSVDTADNYLFGEDGNDTIIVTGAGINYIDSGRGDDTITGGEGVTNFNNLAGTDTITDLGYGNDSIATSLDATAHATLYSTTPSWVAGNAINAGTLVINAPINSTIATLDLSSQINTGSLTLNLPALTGNTTLTLPTTANQKITVTGGMGEDKIVISGQTLTANASLNGGAGTDILSSSTGANIATIGAFNSLEKLEFAGTITLNAVQLDGFTLLTGSGTPNLILTTAVTGAMLDDAVIMTTGTTITLANVANNSITLASATVPSNNTLKIDASALTGTNALTFDGSAEADGLLSVNGGVGADTITGGSGIDTLIGSDGADTFIYKTANTFFTLINVIDSVEGGLGLDSIMFNSTGGNITIPNTVVLNRIQNVEKITAAPSSNAYSISLADGSQGSSATASDFTTIDLSGDTNATGNNTISSSGINGISTIIGSAGFDAITLGAAAPVTTITGGGGADTLSIATTNAVSVNDTDGIAITVTGATSTISTTGALVATNITGGTGVDTITLAGAVSNVATITGGTGLDVIDLGAAHTGGVKLVLTAEGAPPTSATTVDAVITNYVKSLDKISATNLILGFQTGLAGAGVATITNGVATFNAADNDLAKHFAAVAAALQATPGATAIWTEGLDSYVYVSDGSLANTAADFAVKLVGVTAGALTISGNAITAIA